MKFITEDDLRTRYQRDPFISYEPEPDTRLTPGARQFLIDRGVNMYGEQKNTPILREAITKEICCPTANPGHNGKALKPSPNGWRTALVRTKLASVEALFLKTEKEMLDTDIQLAENLCKLGTQFSDIRHMIEGCGNGVQNLTCQGCDGITAENFIEDQGDCIPVSAFHAQLENGKAIVALHLLRCGLREIEPVLWQAFEGNENAVAPCVEACQKVNQIINAISQMICLAIGGKECQRTM